MPAIPKLVNRGPAGLLAKLSERDKPISPTPAPLQPSEIRATGINKIAPGLQHMAVSITSLIYDPDNARLHPERNLQAIRDSLTQYGQVKPVVVQRFTDEARRTGSTTQTNHVVAGNGTMEAALSLGWTELAAVFVDMTNAEAAGYGLADNRTAELAKWDFATVARLDRLVSEAGLSMVGWSMDELEVLRAADWVPPPVDEDFGVGGGSNGDDTHLLISFTPDQHEPVIRAVEAIRQVLGKPELDQAECLQHICRDWLRGKQDASSPT